jgi:hypothetical protein
MVKRSLLVPCRMERLAVQSAFVCRATARFSKPLRLFVRTQSRRVPVWPSKHGTTPFGPFKPLAHR